MSDGAGVWSDWWGVPNSLWRFRGLRFFEAGMWAEHERALKDNTETTDRQREFGKAPTNRLHHPLRRTWNATFALGSLP